MLIPNVKPGHIFLYSINAPISDCDRKYVRTMPPGNECQILWSATYLGSGLSHFGQRYPRAFNFTLRYLSIACAMGLWMLAPGNSRVPNWTFFVAPGKKWNRNTVSELDSNLKQCFICLFHVNPHTTLKKKPILSVGHPYEQSWISPWSVWIHHHHFAQ